MKVLPLLAMVLLSAILFPRPADAAESNVTKVDVEQFDKARQDKAAVVIDVRSAEEYASGHIPGAVNIPVTGKGSEEFESKIVEATKDRKPLVYCRSGIRSATACKKMTDLKIGPIVEFPGGSVAWERAGKPIEKGVSKP